MSKNVTFYLGDATGLSARQLTITRFHRAGDDAAPTAEIDTDVGAVATSTQALPDDDIYQATLQDTRTSGEIGNLIVLNFHTGSLQFPGPASDPTVSLFRITAMEDLSSSSSSSSDSSASSTSSSSDSSNSSTSSSSTSSSSSSSVTSSSSSSSVTSSSSSVTSSSSSSSVTSSSSLSSSSSSVTSSSSSSSSSSLV